MYKTCTLNGKELKRLYFNNKLVYSSEADKLLAVNNYAMTTCHFGEKEEIGEGEYTWQGQTYSFKWYNAPTIPTWATYGSGDLSPWFLTPKIIVDAAHWGGSLRPGVWGAGGKRYYVSEWINLRDWALANGFTQEQLSSMSDIGDIAVAVNGDVTDPGTNPTTLADCPWLLPVDLRKKLFWNGSFEGCIAYHVPQDRVTLSDQSQVAYLAPVIMQSDYSWYTPKNGYAAIPSRDASTKSVAETYDNTYLAYVGDSGKPTFVKIGQYDVVVSQCHSQFAGADFSACLPVL